MCIQQLPCHCIVFSVKCMWCARGDFHMILIYVSICVCTIVFDCETCLIFLVSWIDSVWLGEADILLFLTSHRVYGVDVLGT